MEEKRDWKNLVLCPRNSRDKGLRLKEDVKEKLKISLDAVRQGKRGLSGSEVAMGG
ncbi:MAG: hypothetical protein ABH886_00210 [Candidatus Desantisbacteria bacterium]